MYEAPQSIDIEDWKYEVANGDTILGFHEWQDHKIESGVQS